MSASPSEFAAAVERWLTADPRVRVAILFGSSARTQHEHATADDWSDLDLHVVTTDAAALEHVNWPEALPAQEFCFQAVRPATGGVRKATVLFKTGQLDLVLVPLSRLKLGRLALRLGFHRKSGPVRSAFNEINTCIRSGYRFLKGEAEWGGFYARIAGEMSGVRLSDDEAIQRAGVSLCDALWILQKLERGELAAAQHLLHRSLAETNFALVRELRLRRGEPLPSFGLGRRVETLLPPHELAWVRIDARLHHAELKAAVSRALQGLAALMAELVPAWRVPPEMAALFERAARS